VITKVNQQAVRCAAWWILLQLAAPAWAEQTLYRYEPHAAGQRPANVSAANLGESVLPEAAELSRGSHAGPFQPLAYGKFRGAERYVFAGAAGTGEVGDGFTVEAFLRLTQAGLTGRRVICGTESPGQPGGFALVLDAGRLFGRIHVAGTDGGGASVLEVAAPAPLAPEVWYRLVYRYHGSGAEGAGHVHDIWIDAQMVAQETQPDNGPALESGLEPVVGGMRDGLGGYSDALDADVAALQLHGYPLSDYFLEVPLVRDGSAYFGLIAHHNYLGLDEAGDYAGGSPLERRMARSHFEADGQSRYAEFDRLLRGKWFLPLQNDGYVVQGMAGDPENRRLFLSMYYRDVGGASYAFPSIVVEILLPEGRLGNIFMLRTETGAPLHSHVGGVAYWNGFLFLPGPGSSVTRDPDLYVYDISGIPPSGFDPLTLDGFSEIHINADWKLRDPLGILGDEGRFNSISFTGVHLDTAGRPVLHMGNFQSSRPSLVHLFGLDLIAGQAPLLSYRSTHTQSNSKAQSMHFHFDAAVGERHLWKSFLATSYGDNDSVLFAESHISDRDTPIHSVFARMPAGLEEVFAIGERLWLTSESGAIYYQKRARNPWQSLFPFLAVLDIGAVVDVNGNGIPDQWEAKHGLAGAQDKDADLDGDGYSLYEEYMWDTNPLSAADHPRSSLSIDPFGISLSKELGSGSRIGAPPRLRERGLVQRGGSRCRNLLPGAG